MGHRHQTYILVTDDTRKENILTVYHNQWNFPKIQPPKIIRFVDYIKPLLNKIESFHPIVDNLPLVYLYSASLASDGFIRHSDITSEHVECKGALYGEDNNNGWALIHITICENPKDNSMVIGFKPGSEDCHHNNKGNEKDYTFMNLFDYLSLVLSPEEELDFPHGSTIKERKTLSKINDMGVWQLLEGSIKILEETSKSMYVEPIKSITCPQCVTIYTNGAGCTAANDAETSIKDHGGCCDCHSKWQLNIKNYE